MKSSNLNYILLPRYIGYISAFSASVYLMMGNFNAIVSFSIIFIIIFINSIIRIKLLLDKPIVFMGSILLECVIILYIHFNFNSFAFILLFITTVDMYLLLKLRYSLLISVPILAVIIISLVPFGENVELYSKIINIIVDIAIMSFFAGAAYLIKIELERSKEIQLLNNELRKSRDELVHANRKINEYANKVEKIAILNERTRLAGEIHDTIGHCLTGLSLEINICKKLIDKDVDKAKFELKKAYELSQYALSEVRKSVREIRPTETEGLTGIRALSELITDFKKNTNILVGFKVSECQYRLSPATVVTIYRTVQDALTNCLKHGHANKISIDLSFKENAVVLTIQDNGKGCLKPVKGVGLNTMEERICSLGGKVEFSGIKGFSICSVIPVGVY
jgi:signal transduction histidine kinase